MSAHSSVSPADRRRDLLAAGVLATGVALYVYGFLGLRAMGTRPIAREPGHTALQVAMRYTAFTRAGIGIAAIGLGVVAWSYWVHRTRRAPQR